MSISNMSCAILAGGKATRLDGENKAFLKVGGKTNMEKFLAVTEGIFSETIVVAREPEHYCDFENVKVVTDIFKNIGPLGGIHAALKNAAGDAVFCVSCDMPFLDREIIIDEIAEFQRSECDILVPRIGDYIEPLHAVYSKVVADVIEKHILSGESYSVRSFFHLTILKYWDIADNARNRKAFTNINTRHDIFHAEEVMKG
ncbi:MAG TPA: molybdenum cofactor guanylyltransferase [bacterium]|nr:molybdenum cofactor guanylyltransferase [bacterium]MDX9806705.1 molybdenum cofactor guanylyltransferase [bacterium]HNW16422.1 molybdenum cofactor guanylyltransferase [bacterium]HPV22135.1 molybdenum cofactor guanylyltransferase [bacterium]HQB09295.1 molybdenum cofactor guanylyltransferase [bacterium]